MSDDDASQRGDANPGGAHPSIQALAAAREDGTREGTIGGLAEAAAMCQKKGGKTAASLEAEMVAELRRRFPNNSRVEYHLKLRGLA